MPPPPKNAEPTSENVGRLHEWLTSIMAFRVLAAERPWLFYEEIDRYLGPWGPSGYPIAYGKKYCEIFWNDPQLRRSHAGRAWVRRTLVLLQEALRDFIVERFQKRTLAALNEVALRKAAFESHARAYTDDGVALVGMLSPGLAWHVLGLAGGEMIPGTPNFGTSILQVGETLLRNVPTCAAALIESGAPAHSGHLRRALATDRARLMEGTQLGTNLAEGAKAVRRGRLDHVGLLDSLRRGVLRTEYPNRALSALAAALVDTVAQRREYVQTRYRSEVASDPALLGVFRQFDPQAFP
jgi:hypothetical protein